MADSFANRADHVVAPATSAIAVVPSDTTALTDIPKALYVGTGGTVTMRGVNGSVDTVWKNVANGTILPFRARYVRATGTSAADLLALY
jgi:type 1 fimbria pilin